MDCQPAFRLAVATLTPSTLMIQNGAGLAATRAILRALKTAARHGSSNGCRRENSINDVYFVSKEKGFVLAGETIFTTSDSGHIWQQAHTFSAAEFDGAAPELYSLQI